MAKQVLQRFFAKRAPPTDNATLRLHNVYIFFSRGGSLYAVLLIITFIAGVNYGNNLVLGLCFYLTSIWVVSFHLTFAHVSGLKVNLQEVPLVAAGEIGYVNLSIVNEKSKPSRQIHLKFDDANLKSAKSGTSNANSINRHRDGNTNKIADTGYDTSPFVHYRLLEEVQGQVQVTLPIKTHKRGKMVLPRLIISTLYPLGIMRAWSYVYFAKPMWVYPAPQSFELQATYIVSGKDTQVASISTVAGQDDFDMLDEYVEGESLARVSWAHLASGQGMLTKKFADSIGHERRLDYADMPALNHEEKLQQLSYAVIQTGQSGERFQLNLPQEIGEVGQGETFVRACLLRLAQCP